MTDVRTNSTNPQVKTAPIAKKADGAKTTEVKHDDKPKAHTGDAVHLSAHAKDAAHGDEHSMLKDIAHKAHNPHGALHAIEAGEGALRVASRVATQGSRAASTVAEAAEVAQNAAHHGHAGGHHGIIGKAEHLVSRGLSKAGSFLGNLISKVPGGSRVVNAVKGVVSAPGRAAGAAATAVDGAIAGTRVGNAVKLAGSGARFMGQIGGRIPLVGAVLGGVIGVVDAKDAIHTLQDKKATTKEKVIAGSQGLLSAASGALGVGALGVAAAAAVGLTAPVSVPVLLGAAAITGVGAFALSFFKKH